MSDRPHQPTLTEAERDAILRDAVPLLCDLRAALTNYALQEHEVKRLGGVAENHEGRIATLETQVLAGVHSSSPADILIPVTSEDPRVDYLSPPPPPPRPPMNTYESINALAIETAKQTPFLAKTAETNEKIVESNKKVLEAGKLASARWLGAFIAALAIGLSQNCSIDHLLPHHAPPPSDPQISAPASPAIPRLPPK